jgi:hypothetical protein
MILVKFRITSLFNQFFDVTYIIQNHLYFAFFYSKIKYIIINITKVIFLIIILNYFA